jgi:hypothetical protein
MKKLITTLLVIGLLTLMSLSAVVYAGTKREICHREGNGSFRLIEVNEARVSAHMAHGDFFPGGDRTCN